MTNRAKTLSSRAKSLSSCDSKLKACRGKELGRDRISELPDEIKVYILSLLTMKEAGQTSLLSKKWKYVWAYIPVLNFAATDTIHKLCLNDEVLEVERARYISWVNKVVGSYKGLIIDEFRIRFVLSEANGYSVDDWVRFAMEKRVKRLELDCTTHVLDLRYASYTFPDDLSICSSLTSVRFVLVDVADEILQSILQSCPGLEYLSVLWSCSPEYVEVTEAALSLKYLEISLCSGMKHIEICAPNLVSFTYCGPKISMSLKKTPSLAKLSLGGIHGDYVTNNFLEFSSHLVQLEALTLDMNSTIKDVMKSVDQFPHCNKVKQLNVIVCPENNYEDLFSFASLIKACPFLNKFVLKLTWRDPVLKRDTEYIEDCPHYHLKIIEIVGFVGIPIDLEFIMYLVKNSVALEKIVINPFRPTKVGSLSEFKVDARIRRARKQAEKLRTMLRHGVDLIIL